VEWPPPPRESRGGSRRCPFVRRWLVRLVKVGLGAWLVAGAAFLLDPAPLGLPVAGMRRSAVRSSFGAPRDGGKRQHAGVDLFARRGTQVVAAAPGLVVWRGTTPRGGRVVYALGRRGALLYYAHLDGFAPGVGPGDLVARGTPLGTVGDTGNARGTRPHLHFEARPLALALVAVDPVSLF
jgi:peptidoglycan LD-endopeptidase LytH